MTRAEFNNALEEALQKAARVRAYTGGGCEIALIVTRDVYRFLSEHAGVTFDVRNTATVFIVGTELALSMSRGTAIFSNRLCSEWSITTVWR